jgi:hypothetical protein
MTMLGWIALMLAMGPSSPGAGETAVHLYVRPMPAPKPALKYQLLPELDELKPGNAAQEYLKCFAEQRPFFYSQKAVADRARYRKMPLVELRLEPFPLVGGGPLHRAEWAARMDTLDWQALRRIHDGGMEGLPAELGPLQLLAESLQVRFRAQVARQQFDDAIRTAKTMLALSRHLAEHPTELAGLLGLSVAHLALDALEEMVQQPSCPNLYWALTDLPCPLVDLHKAVQGERIRVAADFRPLRSDAPMPESEIEALVSRLSGVLSFAREQAGLPPRGVRPLLQARARDQTKVGDARRRLIEAGYAPKLVDQFPPLQIILLDEKREYEIRRDDRMKLLSLPLWQIDECDGSEGGEPGREGLLADLLPQIVKLRRTQAALERQIALLRHVEALRLYAAGHDGKLPAKLSDIPVPLPDDPFSGKPFAYAMEGADAHLRGGSPRGEVPQAGSDVHYAVTLLK